jgi:hypothetical protein
MRIPFPPILIEQKLQACVRSGRGDFENFSSHHVLDHERIVVHPALQVRQRRIVGYDAAAPIGLKTAGQQEHAVVKTAFEPFFVSFDELARAAPIVGKIENHDEHRIRPPLDLLGGCSVAVQVLPGLADDGFMESLAIPDAPPSGLGSRLYLSCMHQFGEKIAT